MHDGQTLVIGMQIKQRKSSLQAASVLVEAACKPILSCNTKAAAIKMMNHHGLAHGVSTSVQ